MFADLKKKKKKKAKSAEVKRRVFIKNIETNVKAPLCIGCT